MEGFEGRLLELASDVLTALGRGELTADAPVVRAAAAALAELRRVPATPAALVTAPSEPAAMADGSGRGPVRAPRVAPPVEQVLAVAHQMRHRRLSFAAACAAVAAESGASAQAVRNACTRWVGVSATEWQPMLIDGARAGVVPLARRVAERCPWLVDRVAEEFGVTRAELGIAADAPGAG